MILTEAILAVIVGGVVLWLALQPLLRSTPPSLPLVEPPELEETHRGRALLALKEIEFDRETGKLSDLDYSMLKTKYTGIALQAMRVENAGRPAGAEGIETVIADRVRRIRAGGGDQAGPVCPTCGPRPESDAVFCSSCGGSIGEPGACTHCGVGVVPGGRFCAGCGMPIDVGQIV